MPAPNIASVLCPLLLFHNIKFYQRLSEEPANIKMIIAPACTVVIYFKMVDRQYNTFVDGANFGVLTNSVHCPSDLVYLN